MSIGVGEGIELSATACTLLKNKKLGVSTYYLKMHFLRELVLRALMCCLRQTSKFQHQASFQKSQFVNMPFPSSPGPLYQNEVKCTRRFFILMQIKLIFTRKVAHLASFWKWGFLVLGSGLLFWKEFSCTKKKQMQRILFTNEAWGWN